MFVSPPSPIGEHAIDAAFCIRTNQHLRDLPNKVAIPAWVSNEIGGEALAIPEIRSALEVHILEKLYNAYPRFCDGYSSLPGGRPYARELDMGNDRERFTEDPSHIPLYEGKMVDQYDYRAKAYVAGRGRSAEWRDLLFGSPEKQIIPQWRIDKNLLSNEDQNRIMHYRIGFCDVTSPTNQRSLISSVIPPFCVCGHTVPTIKLDPSHPSMTLLWLGVANTLCIDFLSRKKCALHMTFSIVDSLPIPARVPAADAEIAIARLAASLALVGKEMETFALQFSAEDPGWDQRLLIDPLERETAKAQIEAIYACRILGVDREQLQFVLDPKSLSDDYSEYETFGALERSELREFGEYRTFRLILEAWDSLVEGRQ
jgi:hypothetical protein